MAKAEKTVQPELGTEAGPDSPAEQPSGRDSNLQNADTGVWGHAITTILIAALGLLAAFAIVGWNILETSRGKTTQLLTNTLSSTFAASIDARTAELRSTLEAFAGAPSTQRALAANSEAALKKAGEDLAVLLPEAKRIDIIPKGQAAVDLNATTPISFASLDVIRRAETQPFVGPEASLNQRDVIYAAVPITSDGTVSGVLFAAVTNAYFLAPLKQFDPALGQMSVEQRFEGSVPAQIFQWGDTVKNESPISTNLAARNWQLQFTLSPKSQISGSSWISLTTPAALALGLLLCGVLWGFSRLSGKLNEDAGRFAQYAGRLLRGRSPNLDRYRTPLFQALATDLAQQINAQETTSSTRSNAKQIVPGIEPVIAELNTNTDKDMVTSLLDDKKSSNEFLEVRNSYTAPDDNFGIEVSEEVDPASLGLDLDPNIFRAYDIRGVVDKNLTEDVVYWIGRAFAAEAQEKRQTRTAVGYDGRHSSPTLARSLIRGLMEGGQDVAEIGQVPTPVLYYATHALNTGTGIMVTGSHNPPEYNGLKMMVAGETLAEARILRLRQRIEKNELSTGEGDTESIDLNDHYVDRILEDVAMAQPLKVVVDCGNGVAGALAPRLLEELGCEVIPLYCDVDGDFPNHHPDPADPDTLEDLITVVKAEQADIGLAFDGDGDRLGVVTPKGQIIWPDKLMMLFSQDIIGRNPGGDVIYDVKCGRHLNNIISESGGRPIMWKTGHSHIKAKMKATGALLGGEFSGHICFGERWYGFDDALYSAARLMEILGSDSRDVDEIFAQFPVTFATPEIKVAASEQEKFKIIGRLANNADFGNGTITDIDGVRVDYEDGFGLVRASNTSPFLTLRFEADTQSALERIQGIFSTALTSVDASLKFQ